MTKKFSSKSDTGVADPSLAGQPKYFKVSGTLYWSHVKEKETKGLYPSNAYKLDLSIDDAHCIALEKLGVQIKNKGNDLGNFVTLKSKERQPLVFLNGEKLDPIPFIGNGSKGSINTSLYDNTEANVRAGKGGHKLLGLGNIELTSLVEFSTPDLVAGEDSTSGS